MSIDIKDMEPIKNVKFLKGNIFEKQTKIKLTFFSNLI